jgi:hypothetical protein
VKHDRRAAGTDDIQACPLSSGPFVFGRRDRRTWCNDHPLKIAWQVGEYDEGAWQGDRRHTNRAPRTRRIRARHGRIILARAQRSKVSLRAGS